MMKCLSIMVCAAWISSLLGCGRKPTVVQVDDLSFPVVLIVGTSAKSPIPSSAKVIPNKAELSRMRVELYSPLTDTTISDPPIVIDFSGATFEMNNIQGENGGLWIMANPTGQMPIRFTLSHRKESGIESARALITRCKYLGYDLDQDRKLLRCERIKQAESMTTIMRIIDEEPIADQPETEAMPSQN